MKIQQQIEFKLAQAFANAQIMVINESRNHSVPENSETHFKVTVVSDEFVGMRQVPRHQKIYQLLAEELAGPVHALALHTYTQAQWQGSAPDSPACLGGSKFN